MTVTLDWFEIGLLVIAMWLVGYFTRDLLPMRPYSVIAALLAFAAYASRGSGAKVPEDNAKGDVRVASVFGPKLRRRPLNQRQRRKRERRAGQGRTRAH